MLMRTLFSAVAVAVAIGSAGAANAAIIYQESFETATLPAESYYARYTAGQTIAGTSWTAGGSGVDILSYGPTAPLDHGWQEASHPGPLGKFLDLNGAGATGSAETTLTTLTAPGVYTLTFDARHNTGVSPSQVLPGQVVPRPFEVSIGNLVLTPLLGTLPANALTTTGTWATQTFQFTVTASDLITPLVLKFTSKSSSSPTFSGAYIDKISISSVPEPSSIALAGLGVAGLIGRKVRRRRQAV